MFERRLLAFAQNAKRLAAAGAALQWGGLVCGAFVTISASRLIERIAFGSAEIRMAVRTLIACLLAAIARVAFGALSAKVTFAASSEVKRRLREKLFEKLAELGKNYTQSASAAEIVQTASEGIDQLETYFAKYLPQFLFALLAPVTLAAVLWGIYPPVAILLLGCSPLIPLLLFGIGRMAGRVMRRQWSSYTSLGERFLENLQGMTTLKVYGADEFRQGEMSQEAESFRKSTMRVLRMQLGSILFMDAIAYGGAAAGVILACRGFALGAVSLGGAIAISLLSAEFFIPMRQLGSLFHVSMNGAAASARLFAILDAQAPKDGASGIANPNPGVQVQGLTYTYGPDNREALSSVSLDFGQGNIVALAGASGSGKSTLAAILAKTISGYSGSIKVGGVELSLLGRESVHNHVTLVPHDAYVFSGTVGDNLRLARPQATGSQLEEALDAVRLHELGLESKVAERGANLSGGQRQRLCIARALLKDSDIYIFDEAASNIDTESEVAIMQAIHVLAKTKAVLLISHRLANLVNCDRIYMLENGKMIESGTHLELLSLGGAYSRLYSAQKELEQYSRGEVGMLEAAQ